MEPWKIKVWRDEGLYNRPSVPHNVMDYGRSHFIGKQCNLIQVYHPICCNGFQDSVELLLFHFSISSFSISSISSFILIILFNHCAVRGINSTHNFHNDCFNSIKKIADRFTSKQFQCFFYQALSHHNLFFW
jgi:hypothetical protein